MLKKSGQRVYVNPATDPTTIATLFPIRLGKKFPSTANRRGLSKLFKGLTVAPKNMTNTRAATMIQSRFRGFRTRTSEAAKSAAKSAANGAAIKIQAAARRMAAKKRAARIRRIKAYDEMMAKEATERATKRATRRDEAERLFQTELNRELAKYNNVKQKQLIKNKIVRLRSEGNLETKSVKERILNKKFLEMSQNSNQKNAFVTRVRQSKATRDEVERLFQTELNRELAKYNNVKQKQLIINKIVKLRRELNPTKRIVQEIILARKLLEMSNNGKK